MQLKANSNFAPKRVRYRARIVEELKAAGEEIRKDLPPWIGKRQTPRSVDGVQRKQQNSNVSAAFFPLSKKGGNTFCRGSRVEKEKINLLKIASSAISSVSVKKISEYQKELSKKQLIIKKKYREVQGLEKKAAEEIELLRKLQIEAFKINKELEKLKSKWS